MNIWCEWGFFSSEPIPTAGKTISKINAKTLHILPHSSRRAKAHHAKLIFGIKPRAR
jgi:hypothetical protein